MQKDKAQFKQLRIMAEKSLEAKTDGKKIISAQEMEGILYELQVHQIELEMQNEELQRTYQELEESRNKYLDLYDFAPIGYLTLDENNLILEVNLTLAKLLDISRHNLIKKRFSQFIAIDDTDIFYLHRKLVFETQSLQTCELKLVKRDKTFFDTELKSIAMPDKNGNLNQMRIAITDITQRKQAEKELNEYRLHLEQLVEERTSQLMKTNEQLLKIQHLESIGILAAGIAHDFNNILAIIIGNIHLAKLYAKSDEKVFQPLVVAEKTLWRATNLTAQLLTFSKGWVPVKKVVYIGELIKNAADFSLRGSNIIVEYDIIPDLWVVECDEGQINQVIDNLIINAVQAMPSGGMIKVSAENITVNEKDALSLATGEYVKVSIKDEGIGIDEEHLPKIFDPFFTTKEKGSGLGLATAYSIIKKHNGYIDVTSETGKGTTFYIYLPASFKKVAEKEEEEIIHGKGRILLMDDEEGIRYIIGQMLEHLGYEVKTAEGGNSAIELFKRAKKENQTFDAVILDLTTPGEMGGRETIQRLMEIDPEVKGIASSGYSTDPIIADFKSYGFSGAIVKPYSVTQMSRILHEVIGKRSAVSYQWSAKTIKSRQRRFP